MRKIFFFIVLAVAVGYGWWVYQQQFGQLEPDVRDKAALRTVHEIVEAQEEYRDQYGRYARQLYELGPPLQAGGPSEMGANLIPRDIATGRKLSYQFKLRGYGNEFSVNANPVGPPSSAESAPLRHFYADQTGVVRASVGEPATAGSTPLR